MRGTRKGLLPVALVTMLMLVGCGSASPADATASDVAERYLQDVTVDGPNINTEGICAEEYNGEASKGKITLTGEIKLKDEQSVDYKWGDLSIKHVLTYEVTPSESEESGVSVGQKSDIVVNVAERADGSLCVAYWAQPTN